MHNLNPKFMVLPLLLAYRKLKKFIKGFARFRTMKILKISVSNCYQTTLNMEQESPISCISSEEVIWLHQTLVTYSLGP